MTNRQLRRKRSVKFEERSFSCKQIESKSLVFIIGWLSYMKIRSSFFCLRCSHDCSKPDIFLSVIFCELAAPSCVRFGSLAFDFGGTNLIIN